MKTSYLSEKKSHEYPGNYIILIIMFNGPFGEISHENNKIICLTRSPFCLTHPKDPKVSHPLFAAETGKIPPAKFTKFLKPGGIGKSWMIIGRLGDWA